MSLSICCYNENNINTKRRSDHEISHEVRRDALAAFMTDWFSETLPFGTKILLNGKYRTSLRSYTENRRDLYPVFCEWLKRIATTRTFPSSCWKIWLHNNRQWTGQIWMAGPKLRRKLIWNLALFVVCRQRITAPEAGIFGQSEREKALLWERMIFS